MSTSSQGPDASAKTQPSRWSYIVSPIKESFICTGTWAILAAIFVSVLRLWFKYAHPEKGHIPLNVWAIWIGAILGQFVLMAIYLSVVVVYRRRKNVTSFILLDWRWWVGLVVFSILLKNPPTGWLFVGLIYQVRVRMKSSKMKPRIPSSTAVAA